MHDRLLRGGRWFKRVPSSRGDFRTRSRSLVRGVARAPDRPLERPAAPDVREEPAELRWHANSDGSKNPTKRVVVDLAKARKQRAEREVTLPRVVHLLRRAEQWQGLLDRREVKNRTELARRCGVSAMRVTTILALLKLHPDIRAAIVALPPGTPERLVTERKLRELTALPPRAQIKAFGWLLRRSEAG